MLTVGLVLIRLVTWLVSGPESWLVAGLLECGAGLVEGEEQGDVGAFAVDGADAAGVEPLLGEVGEGEGGQVIAAGESLAA